MGETGCGKTRLIRFMCSLMAQGSGQQNMIILKVSSVIIMMGNYIFARVYLHMY